MFGLMMDQPLMISSLLRHAARNHGDTEIVSRTVEGGIHRYTYADYVALELESTTKHEFLDGEIYAMAGGSEDHSALLRVIEDWAKQEIGQS